MNKLNLYVIFSQHLDDRLKYINSTIDFIKKKTELQSYEFNINVITEPSKEFIDKNIEAFNKRVNYEKYPDTVENKEFNTLIHPLNSYQISNIEKHREIYRHIMNKSENELHFIIEDDVVVGQEYITNIDILLKRFKENTLNDWDILFTCLPSMKQNETMQLLSTRDHFNIFLSKSSYFIRPSVCKKLLEFTEKFKFTLKNSISRFVFENTDIRSMFLNKHTFLEASKIGIFPSTINPNNFLFQNNQFIALTSISNKTELCDKDIEEAEKLYESTKHMNSADILHIMGIIYYKNKDYANAKKYMTDAVMSLKNNKGYLQQNSEILNNCLNMYQYEQNLLDECLQKQSKYS
jgi:tetratricopeptide (TPR) repeat protein